MCLTRKKNADIHIKFICFWYISFARNSLKTIFKFSKINNWDKKTAETWLILKQLRKATLILF